MFKIQKVCISTAAQKTSFHLYSEKYIIKPSTKYNPLFFKCKVVPFLLLVKSHALFPNSEKYVVEIRLSQEIPWKRFVRMNLACIPYLRLIFGQFYGCQLRPVACKAFIFFFKILEVFFENVQKISLLPAVNIHSKLKH